MVATSGLQMHIEKKEFVIKTQIFEDQIKEVLK